MTWNPSPVVRTAGGKSRSHTVRRPALSQSAGRPILQVPWTRPSSTIGQEVSDQARPDGEDGRLHAVLAPELLEDARDVRLRRRRADEELGRDLTVVPSGGDQANDLELPP